MSTKPTITLCMIVKDEHHCIERCLSSLYKYIDRYDITDTGSTDGTQEIIKKFFDDKGIPGEVHQSDWKGFGKSRTESLQNAKKSGVDYAWVIDADDTLEGDFTESLEFMAKTKFSSYSLRITRGENFTWWRNQIFKLADDWKYVGILHEYADVPDRESKEMAQLPGNYGIHARTEGARNVDVTPEQKYRKDAELLEDAITNPKNPDYDPHNDRYHFYLAQSYFDCHDYRNAMKWYDKRAAMGNWQEEVYYSVFRSAMCSGLLNEPFETTTLKFMEAWNYRPNRAEPLHQLSRVFRLNNKPRLAYLYATMGSKLPFPSEDILFIAGDIYEWQMLDEVSATAFYVGQLDEGLHATNVLLTKLDKIPESEHDRIRSNKNMYEDAIKQREQAISNHSQKRKELLEKYNLENKVKTDNKQKSYAKARKERNKKKKKAKA
tara:strand:+ start:138 stop:1442 length:1305 start_codon:yes stop_codon:yes gene_type:complete